MCDQKCFCSERFHSQHLRSDHRRSHYLCSDSDNHSNWKIVCVNKELSSKWEMVKLRNSNPENQTLIRYDARNQLQKEKKNHMWEMVKLPKSHSHLRWTQFWDPYSSKIVWPISVTKNDFVLNAFAPNTFNHWRSDYLCFDCDNRSNFKIIRCDQKCFRCEQSPKHLFK